MNARMRKFIKRQIFWPLVVLLAILLLGGILSGGAFFEMRIVDGHLYGRLIDILRNGSKLMLLAIGMTMVLATGGTDISVGSVMAISGAVACSIVGERLLPSLHGSVGAAVLLAALSGIVCGAFNGLLVSRVRIQPIVATLILLVAGRGIAQLITNGKIVTINSDAYYFINGGYVLGFPFPVYMVIFFLILALVATRKTAFGLFVEAAGCNAQAGRFAGIRVSLITWAVYAFSGAMAAFAGLIESAGIKGADANNAGLLIEMDAILAVAIGGTSLSGGRFSIPASLIGALIIQSITTMVYAYNVPPQATLTIKSILVVIICLAQSREFQMWLGGRFRVGKEVRLS